MHVAAAKLALLAVAAAATSFSSHALADTGARCLPHERDALLAFKKGIARDDYGFLVSWRRRGGREEDCCRWSGVRCSRKTGHVVKLDLGFTGLEGQISPCLVSLEHLEYLDLSNTGLRGINGSVPEFLGSFKNMRYLDLSYMNSITRLPPQLGNLSKLEYLDLSRTYLLQVPRQLGNLSSLRHLDLSQTPFFYQANDMPYMYNMIRGISWLAHLHLLEYLDMSYIDLSMAVDWPHLFNSLPRLEALHLSNCSLPGTSYALTQLNLTEIVELDVSYNDFGNPISTNNVPEFLGSMKNIRYLDLSETSIFSGRVPPQLGNLSNLRHLGLHLMHTDMYSTDISWLTRLHLLEYLDTSSVNLSTLHDWPVVVNMIPHLNYLFFNDCSLPTANQTLAHINLTKLEILLLDWNYFGHPIASCWFWKVSSIKMLGLSGTYLDGPFPDALGGMTSLEVLYFHDNGNAATMTVDLKNLCALQWLFLDGSLSSGNITEFMHKMPRCSPNQLDYLSLRDNNMTGTLPNVMRHLDSLSHLLLSNNSISGHIPGSICMFQYMHRLDLSNNFLEGELPPCSRISAAN